MILPLNCSRCALERQEVAVKWYKNGTELENNDKYRVNTDGHWHYLEIRDITIEDEGKYLAKIAGSSFESMAELLVDGAKVNLQGIFTSLRVHHSHHHHHHSTITPHISVCFSVLPSTNRSLWNISRSNQIGIRPVTRSGMIIYAHCSIKATTRFLICIITHFITLSPVLQLVTYFRA